MTASDSRPTTKVVGDAIEDVFGGALEDAKAATGNYRRILVNPNFRRLWFAGFVSGIGDWLILGILIPTVLALSGGSSSAVAGIMIVKIVPALLLSSVIGSLVDYFDRRQIMLAADVVRFFLVFLLLFTNSLVAIYLVVLLMETASLFFWPSRNALIPDMVEDADLNLANGLMYTTQQAAMVVGLAASATILASFESIMGWVLSLTWPLEAQPLLDSLAPILVGSRAGFVLDAFTFVVSFLLVLGVTVRSRAVEAGERHGLSSIGTEALESFRFLLANVELRGLLVTIFFAIVGGGAIIPVGLDHISTLTGAIPFADQVEWLAAFAGSRQTFIMTFLALGMVGGALLVPRLQRYVGVRLLFPSSIALFSIGMLAFAITTSYFAAAIFALAAGMCISALSVAGSNYVSREVAPSLRGRVFTALESVIRVSILISMVVVAPISDLVGSIVRRALSAEGVASIIGIPITGPRITLVLASGIVAAAAAYGFRKLYLAPSSESDGAADADAESAPQSEEVARDQR